MDSTHGTTAQSAVYSIGAVRQTEILGSELIKQAPRCVPPARLRGAVTPHAQNHGKVERDIAGFHVRLVVL
jgi:hypothetical protein